MQADAGRSSWEISEWAGTSEATFIAFTVTARGECQPSRPWILQQGRVLWTMACDRTDSSKVWLVEDARRVVVLQRPMYSLVEAARILGLAPAKTRAWLDGYERSGKHYEPVIRPEHTGDDVVTWGEFVELGYLREYRSARVPLQRLRPVINELRDRYKTLYPLATATPFVHDQDLVVTLQEELDIPRSLALVVRTGQTILVAEAANRFFRKVEFDPDQNAARIRPAGQASPVVIDPLLRFGRPSVDGVSTERLWELHDAGEGFEQIAGDYEMETWKVRAAIAYEEQAKSLAA